MKKPIQRIAFIGNYLPRRCGIATFTHDLHRAVCADRPDVSTCVVAMIDAGGRYDYPEAVGFQVRQDVVGDYIKAAEFLNAEGFDAVSLQHEYGIFGGEAGGHIMELLSRLEMPIVTTLHTVLAEPTPAQRAMMGRIIDISTKLIVMSQKGYDFLRVVHGVPASKIEIIPHGIPDVPFLDTHAAKEKLGFSGKSVILTFGLLSPNKGIETMLDAMPDIIKSCPNAVYVVLGATHPNLVRERGEAYRESLSARVTELGIEDHVIFFNQFVEQAELLDFISMCDVYVTPYLNENQMTSGTLAYSFGLGRAVVSTPYWHAQELLADGRGVIVPFRDVKAIGSQIACLLTDEHHRDAMRERAYAVSRSMTWPQTAKSYVAAFTSATSVRTILRIGKSAPVKQNPLSSEAYATPELRTEYLLSMCDSAGLMQHAVHCVPDRAHGYCVDDNARALLFASALGGPGEPRLSETLTTRFAAFIQHAWNPDTRRFRNFMSYERRWLEDQGSEDSHGRTLWALGECAARDANPSRRRWAASLFKTALPTVEGFQSLRAWAFTLLGLDAYCTVEKSDPTCVRIRGLLADRVLSALSSAKTEDWFWFEDTLAYDNARLPQALILTGAATMNPAMVEAGMTSLRWLMQRQTAPNGYFRPVGTQSFGIKRQPPEAFDQQPVEAAATISACFAAWRVSKGSVSPEANSLPFVASLQANVLPKSSKQNNQLLIHLIHGKSYSNALHPGQNVPRNILESITKSGNRFSEKDTRLNKELGRAFDPVKNGNALEWPMGAQRAFNWFLGDNDLRIALVDPETGSCRDGLHPDRANENRGAESVLSYLLGLLEIRQYKGIAMADQKASTAKVLCKTENHSITGQARPGSHLVSIPISKSPELTSAPGSSEGRGKTFQASD